MTKYKKNDIASKIEIVEEYLDLKKSGDYISFNDFASRKGIAKSMLYDWITTYEKSSLSNDEALMK